MSKFHTNLKVSQKIHSLGVKAARLAAATARAWGLEAKIIEKGLEILKK